MSNDLNQPAASPGDRLLAALTHEQVRTLLAIVAEAGLLPSLDARLRAADADLADTVRRLTDSSTGSGVAPSDQKVREAWDDLWGEWQSRVSELGDPEGEYANHEEHWHPPFTITGSTAIR